MSVYVEIHELKQTEESNENQNSTRYRELINYLQALLLF